MRYIVLILPLSLQAQPAIDVDHAVDKAISNDQKMDASSSMYACKGRNQTTEDACKTTADGLGYSVLTVQLWFFFLILRVCLPLPDRENRTALCVTECEVYSVGRSTLVFRIFSFYVIYRTAA